MSFPLKAMLSCLFMEILEKNYCNNILLIGMTCLRRTNLKYMHVRGIARISVGEAHFEVQQLCKIIDALTSVKSINRTDAMTLLSTFGSLEKIIEASEEELSFCPGLGPQKASRLHKVLHQTFKKPQYQKVKPQQQLSSTSKNKVSSQEPQSSKTEEILIS